MQTRQQNNHTQQSLEYAAMLSGRSMIGDYVSDMDIAHARRYHEQVRSTTNRPISFVSIANAPKHSAL